MRGLNLIRFDVPSRSGVQSREDVHHGEHGEEESSLSPEFKAEIVELCRRVDRTVSQVAKDFDLTEMWCVTGSSRPRSTPTSVTA